MSNNKKYFVLAVGAIILITAIILGINNYRKDKKIDANNSVKIAGIQTQSYAIGKNPEVNSEDRIYGAKDADLKIFVYEDYSSVFSAKLADTLEKVKQNYNVSIIVRPYVTTELLSKNTASVMSCSGDKWLEMRALLFAQVKNNQINPDNFSAYAKQLDLNEEEFNNCLTNSEKSRIIEKSSEEAQAYSIVGAPTMFIGDEMILGARPYDDYTDSNGDAIEGLKKVIERKLTK